MEILPPILGNEPVPTRTTGHSLSPSFMRLPMRCVAGHWPSNTANEETFTPNLTIGPRAAPGQGSLSNSNKTEGIDLNASWFMAVKNLKLAMEAQGGKQCIGKTAGGPTTKMRRIVDALGNPLGFTVTADNFRDSKASRSLIQIAEEKYQHKAGKYASKSSVNVITWATKTAPAQSSCEFRRLRDGSRRAPPAITARNPSWSTSALTKSGARSRTILKGSREREASQPDTPKPFRCLLPL